MLQSLKHLWIDCFMIISRHTTILLSLIFKEFNFYLCNFSNWYLHIRSLCFHGYKSPVFPDYLSLQASFDRFYSSLISRKNFIARSKTLNETTSEFAICRLCSLLTLSTVEYSVLLKFLAVHVSSYLLFCSPELLNFCFLHQFNTLIFEWHRIAINIINL